MALPPALAGIYACDPELGGCLAVNGGPPEPERRWTMARGYGCFLTQHQAVVVLTAAGAHRSPERFADHFAQHFLMPRAGLVRQVAGIRQSTRQVSLASLLSLAEYYGVPFAILVQRLAGSLLPAERLAPLQQPAAQLGESRAAYTLPADAATGDLLPRRYPYLALDALQRALLTEGQFARFLRRPLVDARRVADALRAQETSAGAPLAAFAEPSAQDRMS